MADQKALEVAVWGLGRVPVLRRTLAEVADQGILDPGPGALASSGPSHRYGRRGEEAFPERGHSPGHRARANSMSRFLRGRHALAPETKFPARSFLNVFPTSTLLRL